MTTDLGELSVAFASDWHVGTGLSQSGGLDRLIARERVEVTEEGGITPISFDIPFLPAKSLTGILRDAAERLAFGLDEGTFGEWSDLVDFIFGAAPTSTAGDHRPARLSIRPARLPDSIAARAARSGDRLSTGRHSTAMTELGAARDHTLRYIEVGRADAVFVGPVQLDTRALDPDAIELVKAFIVVAASLIEGIGAGRRRGLGRCRVEISPRTGEDDWPNLTAAVALLRRTGTPSAALSPVVTAPTTSASGNPDPSSPTTRGPSQSVVIALDIECRTPVIAAPSTESNVVSSSDHIPGRIILPVATDRLSQIGLDAPSLIQSGSLSVEHGYPFVDGVRLLPMPFIFSELKRPTPDSDRYWNTLLAVPPSQAKQVRSGFVHLGADGSLLRTHTVMDIRAHNSINDVSQRPDASVGGLFTYEAIAAGSTFRAILRIDMPTSPSSPSTSEIVDALTGEASIGTSRKDDYGSVVITASELASPRLTATITANQSFLLWCTSPIVVVDRNTLRPSPTASAVVDALAEAMSALTDGNPGHLEIVHTDGESPDVRLRTERIEGFHARWGLPQLSLPVVAAGSVIRLTCSSALETETITALESSGIGLRTAEGFGRIRIQPEELSRASHAEFIDVRSDRGRRITATVESDPTRRREWSSLLNSVQPKDLRLPILRNEAPSATRIGELRSQLLAASGGPGTHPALIWLSNSSSTRSKAGRWGDALQPIRVLLTEDSGKGSLRQFAGLPADEELSDDDWRDGVVELLDHVSGLRKRGSNGTK